MSIFCICDANETILEVAPTEAEAISMMNEYNNNQKLIKLFKENMDEIFEKIKRNKNAMKLLFLNIKHVYDINAITLPDDQKIDYCSKTIQ